jgi:hypothetical protein
MISAPIARRLEPKPKQWLKPKLKPNGGDKKGTLAGQAKGLSSYDDHGILKMVMIYWSTYFDDFAPQ